MPRPPLKQPPLPNLPNIDITPNTQPNLDSIPRRQPRMQYIHSALALAIQINPKQCAAGYIQSGKGLFSAVDDVAPLIRAGGCVEEGELGAAVCACGF